MTEPDWFQPSAIPRTYAFRRRLCRRALFLCINPLLVAESIADTAWLWSATVWSPFVTAPRTRLIWVRIRERRLALCRLRFSFCRARFIADLIFAIGLPAK